MECALQYTSDAGWKQLAINSRDGLPRITWCATGPLTFLPLHAAGIYAGDSHPSGPSKAADFIISSYTPSLTALVQSHARASTHSRGDASYPHVLVVSQPETPGQSPLPCTTDEAASISRHFLGSVTHLGHDQATVEDVVAAMGQHQWVHLACHGIQDDSGDPTKSAFCLYDGRLELSRLIAMSNESAELAVLSACQTAKGDEKLPEEAVHLAAAMLAAGFKSVVATMWSIADEDGPILADALYVALKRQLEMGAGIQVGRALHDAVEELRRKVGEDSFARWVPFVHFGI
jgi:CHAT domain-containing protein